MSGVRKEAVDLFLTEIAADAFGDNIAFDLIRKGGSVDVEAAIVAVATPC